MKKYFIYIMALGLILSTACDPKTFDPVISPGSIQPASLTSPTEGTALVLTEAEADKTVTFEWNKADYGFEAATSYTLQVDRAGSGFANAISLTNSTSTSVTLTYGDINSALIAGGIPDNVANDLVLRVKSDISDEVEEVYSDSINISITPYRAIIQYPLLAVPGSYQGWNPNDSVNAVFDRAFNGQYEGFLYFDATGVEFKFADPAQGWALNWGDTGGDGVLDQDGDNLSSSDGGMHLLKVNLNDFTYSVEPTSWGLIGDATPTGWDSDTDMTYNTATRKLEITVDLVVGAIKFRANDDWALNFGDDAANGSLEYGGENIAITEAGNYTIELALSDADYTYTVTKN
ncbi:MAG: SusE domain-containing protein [Bacteroidia bacterium]|nr:SusE domain-containing protein [Bacteroidia bacterium]